MKSQPRFLKGLLFKLLKIFDPKNETPLPKKNRRHGSTWSYLNNLMCGPSEGRTEGKSVCRMHCYAQRTQLDVHCTLARVPTVCQNTAQDDDSDTRGGDHETNVREHMSRDGSAVKAGNACPKAQSSYYRDVRGNDQTSLLPEVSTRTRDLDHVKSGSTAHDRCAKKVIKNTQKSATGSDHVVL